MTEHYRIKDRNDRFTGGEWPSYGAAADWARNHVRGFYTVVPCDRFGNELRELNAGMTVAVRRHESKPGAGLSYERFTGVLQDDAGLSEGWDVVDVRCADGEIVSVYCFSLEREPSCDRFGNEVRL
jgi:hypothetical protein